MRVFENKDNILGMSEYPDKFFDIAVVDPPYGLGQNLARVKSRTRLAGSTVMKEFTWDEKPPPQKYFDELFRVSKNQIIWGGNYFIDKIKKPSSGWIVWDKVNGDSGYSDVELAYTSFKKGARLFRYMWNGMMQGKSISEGHIMQGNKALNEKRIHPTQKPVNLYKWVLANYAKPGDIILDTNVGSGNSLIACEEMGFDYVGFDDDRDCFTQANKRLSDYRSQTSLIFK